MATETVSAMSHESQTDSQTQEYNESASVVTDSDIYQDNPQEQDQLNLEELNSLAENYSQKNLDKESVPTEPGLILLNNKEEQKAIAIFEIPDDSKIYALSDEEKELIKELFEVISVENSGQYKVIHFRYKDESVLPENKDQAIHLLYGPHLENNAADRPSSTTNSTLSESQKKALSLKKNQNISEILPDKKEVMKKVATVTISPNEGLLGSTKVKTDTGHRALEELKIGDIVACFDIKNSIETYSKVTFVDKIHLKNHIQIIINDQIIQVAPQHRFYIQSPNLWITAQELKENPELRNLIDPNIQDVIEVDQELDMIRITIDSNHNFYITDHNILVHNFIPIVIAISIAFEIGEGAVITWAILAPTLAATSAGLIYWANKKSKHDDYLMDIRFEQDFIEAWPELQNYNKSSQNQSSQTPRNSNGPSQSGKEPDKNNDKKTEIKINDKNGQDKHIFRNDSGHLPDTPTNRDLLIEMVKNSKNRLGADQYGTEWFGRILDNGKQVWATVRNNTIKNGGINDIPKTFNPKTGLSKI